MKALDRLSRPEQEQATALLVARYGLPLFGQIAGGGREGLDLRTGAHKNEAPSPSSSVVSEVSSEASKQLEALGTTKTSVTTEGSKAVRKRPVKELPEGFARFWALYPSKVGRDDALRVWIRGEFESKTNEILTGLERNRSYLMREGGQFIPNPRTWLHQGRWQDEPRPASALLTSKTAGNAEAVRQFVEKRQ